MTRLSTIEDYANQLNLTPEQQEFDRIWHAMGPVQRRGGDMPYCSILFKPAVRRFGSSERGRVTLLRPNRLVVKANEVSAVFINRIPTNHWRGVKQNRAFRINLAEVPFRVFPSDGEVHASASEISPREVYQVDLGINPRQDGPLFEEYHWSADQLIPQDPELRAIKGGQYQIRRDAIYCDLMVDEIAIYRFPLDQLDNVEFVAESLAIVKEGDVLAKMTGPVLYGQAVFNEQGQPKIHRVHPPVLSATRKVPLLQLALKALDKVSKAATLPIGDESRPDVPPMSRWAPTQLAEFDLRTFSQLRDLPGWAESIDIWSGLRQAVAPGQDFFVCSPCDEELEFCRVNHGPDRLELIFVNRHDIDEEVVIDVPKCAEVLESIEEPGAIVRRGDPIADWVPRKYYASWEEVRDLLGADWPFAVDAFLAHVAIWPGELARDDYEVLIDARYVSSVLHHSTEKHKAWLDFRLCAEYLDESLGAIVPPPISQEDWRDMLFTCNGIGYDMRPVGDRMTSSPICEQTRSRRESAVAVR